MLLIEQKVGASRPKKKLARIEREGLGFFRKSRELTQINADLEGLFDTLNKKTTGHSTKCLQFALICVNSRDFLKKSPPSEIS